MAANPRVGIPLGPAVWGNRIQDENMSKETILVVDDEEDILELVRYHLVREGFEVIGALTGEQGLQPDSTRAGGTVDP